MILRSGTLSRAMSCISQTNLSQLRCVHSKGEISNRDHRLQVGRAIRTLRLTLPRFFDDGLSYRVYGGEEEIYAPNVALYLPNFHTLHPPPLKGRAVYLRSASLLRLAFVALHSDAAVTLKSTHYYEGDLRISLMVSSINRLTRELSEWDSSLFRYTFDNAGLIDVHEVLRINPPPTSSAIEGLRAVWMRLQHKPEEAVLFDGSGSNEDFHSKKKS
ncbi:hypothetical protein E3Q23_02088 [Wallemia mellicola]|uniref:Uncharacterized protein n=1 Tax=Wallemia mellicola TaxID=1708541 RepID=A0A4T0QVF5_9BASI|nr:hypothetical protein E3Q23_02088 [Wallemia mellicola]TIC04915.1 hypothetical protein E3Q16_02479 [Wallemia mellicola]TIC10319.1 hypothetical protein E3Q14_02888 [Wallemia mellicola]TIC10876.1 hypothetical protein E3Q15_02924 [Wallemia mellicola]TIC28929.1 hypothetical protein E3Q10_02875 [Wallemia mellicola]